MATPIALIVETTTARRDAIRSALAAIGCEPQFTTVDHAMEDMGHRQPDVVILEASERDPSAEIACLERLHAAFDYPQYLFLTPVSSEDLAIRAFHSGARRYLKEPWTASMLQSAVASLLPDGRFAEAPDGLKGGERFVGRSDASRSLRSRIARIASAGSNVLVTGETGTGKELVAELIHANGPRSASPFVCLNTAAIPDALLENELFGHERGAFTGAITSQAGKLVAAKGGTVFLDEIGDVSRPMQAKILRVLEGKSIYRLGGTRSIDIDVRIIAATNQDLEQAVAEGRFRKDLYYRLNVIRIELPPLRQRVKDIPFLVDHYLRKFNRDLGRSVRALSRQSMDVLCAYPWPGNVRELRNVIEALLVNLAPETTGTVHVPPEVVQRLALAFGAPLSERERLLGALAATNWNKSKAASQLHWSRMTLYRKMHQHHVSLRK